MVIQVSCGTCHSAWFNCSRNHTCRMLRRSDEERSTRGAYWGILQRTGRLGKASRARALEGAGRVAAEHVAAERPVTRRRFCLENERGSRNSDGWRCTQLTKLCQDVIRNPRGNASPTIWFCSWRSRLPPSRTSCTRWSGPSCSVIQSQTS